MLVCVRTSSQVFMRHTHSKKCLRVFLERETKSNSSTRKEYVKMKWFLVGLIVAVVILYVIHFPLRAISTAIGAGIVALILMLGVLFSWLPIYIKVDTRTMDWFVRIVIIFALLVIAIIVMAKSNWLNALSIGLGGASCYSSVSIACKNIEI